MNRPKASASVLVECVLCKRRWEVDLLGLEPVNDVHCEKCYGPVVVISARVRVSAKNGQAGKPDKGAHE